MKRLIGVALVASLAVAVPFAPAKSPNPYKVPPGQFCKGQNLSKKHIPGQKGTPFSQCVTAMAKLQRNDSLSPAQACVSLKKAKGKAAKKAAKQAFNKCVAAGNDLRE